MTRLWRGSGSKKEEWLCRSASLEPRRGWESRDWSTGWGGEDQSKEHPFVRNAFPDAGTSAFPLQRLVGQPKNIWEFRAYIWPCCNWCWLPFCVCLSEFSLMPRKVLSFLWGSAHQIDWLIDWLMCACLQVAWKARRGSPRVEVICSCELLCICWEINPSSLVDCLVS